MRTRVDALLEGLISNFSSGDEGKRMELVDEGPLVDCTPCYEEALGEFKRKCIGQEVSILQ